MTMPALRERCKRLSACVRPAGALGGRLDHTLANLNTLHRHAGPPLALLGEGNLVRLLRPGRSEIAVDRGLLGPACGLVALGAPATASSSGLRWDLGAACPANVSPDGARPCTCTAQGWPRVPGDWMLFRSRAPGGRQETSSVRRPG